MKWIVPLAILIFFEFVADVLAKKWSLLGGAVLAGGALAAYMLANTFWLFALKNGSGLARGATIFAVGSTVVAILIGIIMYHESVTRAQFVGMVLGIVSLVFIFWE